MTVNGDRYNPHTPALTAATDLLKRVLDEYEAAYNTAFWRVQKEIDAPEIAAEARRQFSVDYAAATNTLIRVNRIYASMKASP